MARGEAGVSAPTIERRGRRDINVRDRAYPDQPAKYHSVVKFAHPETGRTAEEWFAAKREQIVGTTPKLDDLAGGPKG
jgi:hypothetical protein